jgi:hypothetical protein
MIVSSPRVQTVSLLQQQRRKSKYRAALYSPDDSEAVTFRVDRILA